jgi:hypothetical protein
MKKACLSFLFLLLVSEALNSRSLFAQEAGSGFDLRATLTGQAVGSTELTQAPRSGSSAVAGFRSMVYPTWKINSNLFVTGAGQFTTRPFFSEDFSTQGYGAKGSLLQATLNYANVSNKGSILLRAGELPTAFGSFLLRYDDADNALTDLPMEYGYYYAPVSMYGLAGAQIDATRGKWDARAQFANSSPANPRSLFQKDQYGNWAGGAGYTIRQGFRVGASAYWGPYLDRQYEYFFPGEAKPSTLPAQALGVDAGWAHGHTSVLAEVQAFVLPYKAIPTYREWAGYGEVKQVLNPRWFVAVREGVTSASEGGKTQRIESSAGFRPDRFQLIKVGYEFEHYATGANQNENTLAVQFVTTLHFSEARN